jgi:hypothetical protein
MQQADLFVIFTERLDTAALRYMVSGSVAAMVYGEPRLTNDIDIILHVSRSDLSGIVQSFPLDSFYCPPEDVLEIEMRRKRRGHFNLIHHETGHKADIYLCGDDPLHAWGLTERRQIDLGEGRSLWVAPPEYVILRKLEYFKEGGSEKHKTDIQGILEVSGEDLDMDFINTRISRLGVELEWNTVAGEVGFL